MLSIPIQQVARVYHLHAQELAEKEAIEEMLPAVAYYNPSLADTVKTHANVGMGNMGQFAAIWARLIPHYFYDYLDAFLFTTKGYWFVDDTSHAAVYDEGLSARTGYLLTDTKGGYNVEHHSFFPALEACYEKLFSANEYQSIPVIGALFCPAFFIWTAAAVCLMAALRKNSAVLWLGCYALGLFVSVLPGPVALIRYLFPLVLLCPILLNLVFCGGKAQTGG